MKEVEEVSDSRYEGTESVEVTGTTGWEEVTTSGHEITAAPTLGPNAFWGIDEEPYRTVLFYVLISCSVLLVGTLVLLLISMCYARYRGARSQRRAEESIPAGSLPSKGSLKDRLAQQPSKKTKVSHV